MVSQPSSLWASPESSGGQSGWVSSTAVWPELLYETEGIKQQNSWVSSAECWRAGFGFVSLINDIKLTFFSDYKCNVCSLQKNWRTWRSMKRKTKVNHNPTTLGIVFFYPNLSFRLSIYFSEIKISTVL